MEYSHEIINYPNDLPLNLMIHTVGRVEKHWHQSLELLTVASGEAEVTVSGSTSYLEAGDVILINSNNVHGLKGKDAVLITMQIKPELMKNLPEELKNALYSCDSTKNREAEGFACIRSIAAKLLKLNLDGGKYINVMNESLFYHLIYELYANFADGTVADREDTFRQLSRLKQILTIISRDYNKKLTLEGLAGEVYVTPQYLSKFFKQSMGVSLTDHIRATRLHHATNELKSSEDSIEAVALNNGFPNTRAFVEAFRAKHGVLPSLWREQHTPVVKKIVSDSKDKNFAYYENDTETVTAAVNAFINTYLSESDAVTPVKQSCDSAVTVPERPAKEIKPGFKRFIGVSRAKELLYSEVRDRLTQVQREIGFDYIKMHSILDDDLFVYTKGSSDEDIYNFNLTDSIFDFLLSINLKPIIQFSFMPSALAADKSRRLFHAGVIISEPADTDRWCALVDAFTRHLIDRYSAREVRSWLFSVWNEPGSANELFGFSSDDTFYRLFRATYETVKAIDPTLSFGGPAGFSAHGKDDDWLIRFLRFADKENIRPDFITTHYYDIDLSDEFFAAKKTKNALWLSPRTGTFSAHFRTLRKRIDQIGYKDTPLYVTEWNSTTSHKDKLSDTCFKSSYIVQNLMKASDDIDGLCYWLLTDLHEENQLSPQLFHGGLGLFTVNGIPKPAYHALRFLSKMKGELLYEGDGIAVYRHDDSLQLLLCNYHHYSDAYAKDIGINVTYTDRYTVFPEKGRKTFEISFPDLRGEFLVTEEYVNRSHGSAFDQFIKMGAHEPLSREDCEYLRSISIPRRKAREEKGSPLLLKVSMEAFEIRLITVKGLDKSFL